MGDEQLSNLGEALAQVSMDVPDALKLVAAEEEKRGKAPVSEYDEADETN